MWQVSLSFLVSVILASSVHIADSAFSRQCEHAGDCIFEPRGSDDRVYLDCSDRQCQCAKFTFIADVPMWDMVEVDSKCRIAEGGPCGSDRKIQVHCQPDAECIESRCRKMEHVGTAKEGQTCNENIDCMPGLKCSQVGFYFQAIKRCTNLTFEYDPSRPESPHYPGQQQGEESMEVKGTGDTESSTGHQHHHHHGNQEHKGHETSQGGSSGPSSRSEEVESPVPSAMPPVNQESPPVPAATSSGGGTAGHSEMQPKADAQPRQNNAGHQQFTISTLLLLVLVSTTVVVGMSVEGSLRLC